LRGIRAGSWLVGAAFCDPQTVAIAPSSVAELTLSAMRDGVVRGTVVDAGDRPVAGARLWLSQHDDWERGFEVARSGDDGCFELPARAQQYIGARKTGHAPSRLRQLSRITAEPLLVRLPSLGGAVRGRVIDQAGAPLADALVQVGERGGRIVAGSTTDETYVERARVLLRTDARGTFHADGVGTGSTKVHAWAADHGIVVQAVLVEAGRTSDVVLTLPRAATVEGTVRDAQRSVVPGALIAAGDSGYFGSVRVHSDASGRFRLDHVSPGDVELLAELGPAYALVKLHLAPGQVATCDPVLRTHRLAGTLVGPAGVPIAGYEIGTFADGAPVESATTDAAGRFVLAGMRDATVDLVVSVRGMGIAQRNDVPVDEPDVVIRLTDAEQPSATIRGRIVDEHGNGLPRAVSVMNAATSFATRVEASLDGTFVCDALPAGTWWLSIDGHPLGSVQLPPIVVAPHENRRLDDVVLAPAGRIELKLRGLDKAPALVRFAPDDGTSARYLTPDGMNVAGELTRGGYTALAEVDGMAGAVSFVLHAGKTTRAELVFAPAAAVDVEFRGVERRPGDTLRTVARDAAGNVVGAGILDFRLRRPDGPPTLRFRVPPGACVLDTRHSDGRTTTTRFTAGPAGTREHRVVVELPAK
ncbi:MAG TPA: carboxypeptidase-like regulatory domain-containing protein, partial [Planctomycetota bacterium]|nr:carboxypeptidase-like regulatory domain-containing protein [Planctomycetota bacterium]